MRLTLGGTASGGGGTARMSPSASTAAPDVATSMPKVAGRPIVAMRTPPSAGPAIIPTSPRSESSAAAAISSSRGTRRGTIESRAGRRKPSNAAPSGAARKSTQSFGSPRREMATGERAGLRLVEERGGEEDHRHQRERNLRELEHAPAVDGVRERSSDQCREEQRDELCQAEEPDGERRSRQLVDLIRDRDIGEHRAEEREGLPDVEQAVFAVPP